MACTDEFIDFVCQQMDGAECGFPYDGAKEHYILDIEHGNEAKKIVTALEQATPFPKKRAKKP